MGQGRLGSALSLALAGALSLFAALLAHEILTFGASGHAIIGQAECPDWPCPTLSVIIVGLVFKGIGAGLAFAALGAFVTLAPSRLRAAGLLWIVQYLWGLVGMASGYREQFGTTWAWWEPFAELLWQPALSLGLMAAGIVLMLGIDRVLRP